MSAASISCSAFLLIGSGAALVVLGFLDFLPDHPQRLFQELRGVFTVRSLESHGVNLDFASCADNDFDGSVHDTPMSTSLMEPFC